MATNVEALEVYLTPITNLLNREGVSEVCDCSNDGDRSCCPDICRLQPLQKEADVCRESDETGDLRFDLVVNQEANQDKKVELKLWAHFTDGQIAANRCHTR